METLEKSLGHFIYEEVKEVKANLAHEIDHLRQENMNLRRDVKDEIKEIRMDTRELTSALRASTATIAVNNEQISMMRADLKGYSKSLAAVQQSIGVWDAFRLVFPGLFTSKKTMVIVIFMVIAFLGFTADGIIDMVHQVSTRLSRYGK